MLKQQNKQLFALLLSLKSKMAAKLFQVDVLDVCNPCILQNNQICQDNLKVFPALKVRNHENVNFEQFLTGPPFRGYVRGGVTLIGSSKIMVTPSKDM